MATKHVLAKRNLNMRVRVLVLAALCLPASLADDGAKFDVRDFGAAGDGVTDDTAAIQRALDTAANATVAFMHDGAATDHAVVAARATVLFPRGHYVVSAALVLHAARTDIRAGRYHEPPDLLGEGRAVVRQVRNDTDIFLMTTKVVLPLPLL